MLLVVAATRNAAKVAAEICIIIDQIERKVGGQLFVGMLLGGPLVG